MYTVTNMTKKRDNKSFYTLSVLLLFVVNTHFLLYASECKCDTCDSCHTNTYTTHTCCTDEKPGYFCSGAEQYTPGKCHGDDCSECTICNLRDHISYTTGNLSRCIVTDILANRTATYSAFIADIPLYPLLNGLWEVPPSCPKNILICLFLC